MFSAGPPCLVRRRPPWRLLRPGQSADRRLDEGRVGVRQVNSNLFSQSYYCFFAGNLTRNNLLFRNKLRQVLAGGGGIGGGAEFVTAPEGVPVPQEEEGEFDIELWRLLRFSVSGKDCLSSNLSGKFQSMVSILSGVGGVSKFYSACCLFCDVCNAFFSLQSLQQRHDFEKKKTNISPFSRGFLASFSHVVWWWHEAATSVIFSRKKKYFLLPLQAGPISTYGGKRLSFWKKSCHINSFIFCLLDSTTVTYYTLVW